MKMAHLWALLFLICVYLAGYPYTVASLPSFIVFATCFSLLLLLASGPHEGRVRERFAEPDDSSLAASISRLGDSLTGKSAQGGDGGSEETEGDTMVVLSADTFQMHLRQEGQDAEEKKVVDKEFPFDDKDPSFTIDPEDPYYSRDIALMRTEYPAVGSMITLLSSIDPAYAQRFAAL